MVWSDSDSPRHIPNLAKKSKLRKIVKFDSDSDTLLKDLDMDKYDYDTSRISATGRPRIRSPRLSPSRSSRLSSSLHSPRQSSGILDTNEIDDLIDRPYRKFKSSHHLSLNEVVN